MTRPSAKNERDLHSPARGGHEHPSLARSERENLSRDGLSRAAESILFVIGVLAVAVFHGVVAARFLGGGRGHVGHDYSYFLPQLLNGCYWREQNDLFAIPWFTPALGGGIPFYANPACIYASVPQALAFAIGPLAAVRATLVVFAVLGFTGMYVLMRRTLAASTWAALFGATAFALNGFFFARMLVGHLGFHSCMLMPALAHCVLRPLCSKASARGSRTWSIARDTVLAGLGFAYLFQSGNFYGALPALIAIGGLAAIVVLLELELDLRAAVTRLALAGVLALCLSAAKLAAALAFVSTFPRNEYPLPGTKYLWDAALLAVRALFFEPPVDLAQESMVHWRWRLGRQELEYGITWIPLVLLALWTAVAIARAVRERTSAVSRANVQSSRTNVRARAFAIAALIAALLLPIALNTYQRAWTEALERVPILGSSSTLVRCFVAYVPLASAGAALAIDRALPRSMRAPIAIGAALVLASLQSLRNWSYYAAQPYDPAPVERAFASIGSGVPPVTEIRAVLDASGQPSFALDRNDALCSGGSQYLPYEPIFGYRLESFPFGSLHLGPTHTESDAHLNVRNPALFLFPSENGGEPGDLFRVEQRDAADAFLAYRPFAFEKPFRQRAAEVLNLLALAAAAIVLACLVIRAVRMRSSAARIER